MKVKNINKCLDSNDRIIDEISMQISLIVGKNKDKIKKTILNSKSRDIAINSIWGYEKPPRELIDLVDVFERVVFYSGSLNNKEVE